jgi:PadR family transcriptional regulator, regulatory protein PadR
LAVNLKGTLPVLILQVLSTGPRHGYWIAQDIKGRSKGILDFKEGTLYPALHVLEEKGLIRSAEKVENGRMRRYYRLTQSGIKVLAKEQEQWQTLSAAVSMILGEA